MSGLPVRRNCHGRQEVSLYLFYLYLESNRLYGRCLVVFVSKGSYLYLNLVGAFLKTFLYNNLPGSLAYLEVLLVALLSLLGS